MLLIGVISRGLHDLVCSLAGEPQDLVRHSFLGCRLLRKAGVGVVPFDLQALVGLIPLRVFGAVPHLNILPAPS